jgi:putative restriction endonuclease
LLTSKPIGCIVLRGVHFFPENQWLPWGIDEGWHPNIVAFKSYNLGVEEGLLLQGLMHNGKPAELTPAFELVSSDARLRETSLSVVREGQGAFRLRVLDAYGRRCAITGERSLPTLEAAHIQPYLGPASNHVQNGLSLRADIHNLFDEGYVTVTPELRFEVSKSLKEDFKNGKEYYALDGQKLLYLPKHRNQFPSEEALEWHANQVYKG